MLTISARQMEILDAVRRSEFLDRVCSYLTTTFGAISASPDDLRARVEALWRRAASYGLNTEFDVVVFCDLTYRLGDSFDQRLDWASAILVDPTLPTARKVPVLQDGVVLMLANGARDG